MSLSSKNKISAAFSMSSLTDIIFLLLIFFMLTSTLVSPNALKLLLPNSSSQTQATQSVSVSITKDLAYYVNREQVSLDQLRNKLTRQISNEDNSTVVLNADKSVPIEHVVNVMNIANEMGIRMILATSPKK